MWRSGSGLSALGLKQGSKQGLKPCAHVAGAASSRLAHEEPPSQVLPLPPGCPQSPPHPSALCLSLSLSLSLDGDPIRQRLHAALLRSGLGSLSLVTPLAAPRVQSCSLRSLEFEPRPGACYRSLHPWLRLGYSVALSALSSSSLVQRRATRGSLSLATPLAWQRLGHRVALSVLSISSLVLILAVARYALGYSVAFSALSTSSLVLRPAVAHYTIGFSAPRVQCCSLRSLECEPRSESRCRSLHPWLRLGYSVALSAVSSSKLFLRLAVARYTHGYASGTLLISPLSRI